jgi:hypothetical protein
MWRCRNRCFIDFNVPCCYNHIFTVRPHYSLTYNFETVEIIWRRTSEIRRSDTDRWSHDTPKHDVWGYSSVLPVHSGTNVCRTTCVGERRGNWDGSPSYTQPLDGPVDYATLPRRQTRWAWRPNEVEETMTRARDTGTVWTFVLVVAKVASVV